MKIIPILFAMACIAFSCGQKPETFAVTKEILNEAVYASGELMPKEYYFIRSNVSDRMLRSMVEEGDSVRKGQVLAVLGTPSEDRQLDILTQQVLIARKNQSENSPALAELQGRIRLAKEKYAQDSLMAARYKRMLAENAISAREAEQAGLRAQASLTEYRNLQLQQETLRNQLTERLLQAEQQLAALKQAREGKVLTSPLNGIVYSVYFDEGEMVRPFEPLLLVGFADRFKLELLVDERDINRIKIGQKVYFETNAYKDRQFEGRISKMVAVLQKETRSFSVEAEVYSKERFYPQSSVEANIIVRENIEALVIPSGYLLSGDSVNVRTAESTERISVETGTRSNDWIEIKSGLKEGDVISR